MRKIVTDFFAPYSGEQVVLMASLVSRMSEYGLTVEDVSLACSDYIDRLKQDMLAAQPQPERSQPNQKQRQSAVPQLYCPICGSRLLIRRVNVSKCTAIGGPWKTILECHSSDCPHTELSELSVSDWGARK